MKKEDLKTLAKLSRIKLTDKEVEKYTPEMSAIIDSANVLSQLDTKNVPVYSPHTTNLSDLREDKAKPGLTQTEVLENAPFKSDGFVKVYGKVSESVDA